MATHIQFQLAHRKQGNKFCAGCQTVKPLAQFYATSRVWRDTGKSTTGYSARCRPCNDKQRLRRRSLHRSAKRAARAAQAAEKARQPGADW
jgi:hypothetical protein